MQRQAFSWHGSQASALARSSPTFPNLGKRVKSERLNSRPIHPLPLQQQHLMTSSSSSSCRLQPPPQGMEPSRSVTTTINLYSYSQSYDSWSALLLDWLSTTLGYPQPSLHLLLHTLCFGPQGAAARASVAPWTARAPKRTTRFDNMWVGVFVLENPRRFLFGATIFHSYQLFSQHCFPAQLFYLNNALQ